jgi:hypothetical protein
VPERRRRRTIARRKVQRCESGGELGKRQPMQPERRARFCRNRPGEIVHRPARRAKQKHLVAGSKPIHKRTRFAQTDRRRGRLNGSNHLLRSDGLFEEKAGLPMRRHHQISVPDSIAGKIEYGGASPPGMCEV